MIRRLFLLLAFFLSFEIVNADWRIDFNTNSGYTNNLTNNYKKIKDKYIAPQLRVSYHNNNFTLYYKGNSTQLLDSVKYNRYKQKFGFNYYQNITNNINLYFGGRGLWRKNKSLYSYYDYLDSRLFTNLKIYFSNRTYLKTGIVSNYKNFFEVESWRHIENDLWTMINTSLPTKTTLRGYLSYKNRDFLSYQDTSGQIQEINTLWLLEGKFRIAQSISRDIGAYTEFSYQYNPSEDNPDKLNFSSFSPIDDYFGYLGWNWITNVKTRIFNNSIFALKFNYFRRKYLNRPVYEYNIAQEEWIVENGSYNIIEPHRIDEGYKINLSAEYRFKSVFGRSNNFRIKSYIFYRENTSNDVYFTYDKIALGLDLTYLMNL
ncbi:MAG: hypothetical protein K9N00_06005 [Candidatus Marinimicrobia bacterium]|nr:hypothetical protein [Candidatus Neomarinimicrobiota bacterium]